MRLRSKSWEGSTYYCKLYKLDRGDAHSIDQIKAGNIVILMWALDAA